MSMSESFLKTKNGSRSDQIQDTEDHLHTLSHSRGQTSQQHSTVPTSFPGTLNPMSAIPASNDIDSSIMTTVVNKLIDEVWKLPSGAYTKGSSSSEVVKDVISMNIRDIDPKTKAKALRCQIADLESQVNSSMIALENAKKDKKETVELLKGIYQNVSRECIKSRERVEYYKALVAERVARNRYIRNYRRHGDPNEPVFKITQFEALLIALLTKFFTSHQFGAHIDYICSYLLNFNFQVEARDIENCMRRFPRIFREETTGIGATLETTWKYLSLK